MSCECGEDVWGGDRCGGDQGGSHSQLCGGEGEAGVQGQCGLREAGPQGWGGAHLSGGISQGITLGRADLSGGITQGFTLGRAHLSGGITQRITLGGSSLIYCNITWTKIREKATCQVKYHRE